MYQAELPLFAGGMSVGGSLNANGGMGIGGALSIGGALTCGSNASVNGTLNVVGSPAAIQLMNGTAPVSTMSADNSFFVPEVH